MSSATERGLSPCFQAAFTRFETTVSREDARIFQHTSLEDVWNAIRDTEAQMKARKSLRALKRVEPFLLGIEQYAKVIEVLCNGTPFLPWLWVLCLLCITEALICSLMIPHRPRLSSSSTCVAPEFIEIHVHSVAKFS